MEAGEGLEPHTSDTRGEGDNDEDDSDDDDDDDNDDCGRERAMDRAGEHLHTQATWRG